MIKHDNGIYCVDALYEGKENAAIYIIVEGDSAALVDTAHNASLPVVREALAELGIADEGVEYILLTHVHLDHAGGAGLFMETFPKAKMVVHKRGSRHMVNPEKLIAGVREVYGAAETERMYGELKNVPEERIITPPDGHDLRFGGRAITCLDTPGHAKHHMAYFDRKANAVFSGDVFGMSYRGIHNTERQGIIPTTSPIQFDPTAMYQSMDRIVSLKPDKLYPTHFGELRDILLAEEDLHRQVDEYLNLTEECAGDFDKIKKGLVDIFLKEAQTQGWQLTEQEILDRFDPAIDVNAQGLAYWYKNKS